MPTLIKKDTLDRMFNDRVKMHHFEKGRCYSCGSEVTIKIDRVPGSYGLSGGALYEETNGQILIKCDHCLNVDGHKT